MQKYSIESVAKLYKSKGRVVASLTWDRDDDISNDLNSSDPEMRKQAKKFAKTGLTEAYANENIEYIREQYDESSGTKKKKKLSLTLDLETLKASFSLGGGDYSFSDALALFSVEGLKSMLNSSGGGMYLQAKSYLQISNIAFEAEDGNAYRIESWTLVKSIHNLDYHLSSLQKRKRIAVKENKLYQSINGEVFLINPKEQWGYDNQPTGKLITSGAPKVSWFDDFTFDKNGAVANLEEVEFLPMHPDMTYSLQREIEIDLNQDAAGSFNRGDVDLERIINEDFE